jgi:hypothetical protein
MTGTVRRLLAELGRAVGNWAALARRHRDVVLEDAARQLSQLTVALIRRGWFTRHERSVPLPRRDLPVFHLTLVGGGAMTT